MRLTREACVALDILQAVNKNREPCFGSKHIAEQIGESPHFTSLVLDKLTRNCILVATGGTYAQFRLGPASEDLRLSQLLEVFGLSIDQSVLKTGDKASERAKRHVMQFLNDCYVDDLLD